MQRHLDQSRSSQPKWIMLTPVTHRCVGRRAQGPLTIAGPLEKLPIVSPRSEADVTTFPGPGVVEKVSLVLKPAN